MRRALLVLPPPREIPRYARELGKTQNLFVWDVRYRDAHEYGEQVMLAESDLLDAGDDDHIMANGLATLGLEHLGQLGRTHARPFRHLNNRFSRSHRGLL